LIVNFIALLCLLVGLGLQSKRAGEQNIFLMKLRLILYFSFLLLSCNQNKYSDKSNWKTIEIGIYFFDFPPEFQLIEGQGIDTYVGEITNTIMSFSFDAGRGSANLDNENEEKNIVIVDTIDNHGRKIILGLAPKTGTTGVFLRELGGDKYELMNKESLIITTTGLTEDQQQLALEIFRTGRPR
jgi:hypothetical protein